MARWLVLLLLGVFTTGAMVGCEIDADADDDGGKLEVDVDD
ncbi:hypothetical protein [Fontivita pretiosa]